MNPRRILIVIVSIVLLVLVGVLLSKYFQSKKPEKQIPRINKNIISVKSDVVKYQEIQTKITSQGRLSSNAVVTISTEVQGKILKGNIPLKKGQSFKKGEILFRVDATESRLNLKATKSRFLNSLANILPDIKIDFAERFEDWNSFFNSIDLNNSLPELPEAQSPQERVFLASRNILSEYYSIKREEVRLAKYTIRAPFAGSLTDVSAEVGAVISPGMRVANIINTTNLELELPVIQNDAKYLKLGQKVSILSADRSQTWKGILLRKSNYVDQGTQSVLVYVKIVPLKGVTLYQGQYLYAEFGGIKLDKAFELPRKSILEGDFIYSISQDSLLEKKHIVLLKNDLEMSYVNGLEEGERVVVEPLINVQEGTKVSYK